MTAEKIPYWFYTGKSTTPINLGGKNSIVLKPRSRFHAPAAAVSHLVSLKLVKRLPDPPEPKPKPEPKPEAVAVPDSKEEAAGDGGTKSEGESGSDAQESGAGEKDDVASQGEAGEAEVGSSAPEQEKEPSSSRSSRKGRQRRRD